MSLAHYLHPNTKVRDNNLQIHLYSRYRFNAITDRTQADVDRVRYLTNAILTGVNTEMEYTEFQSNLKGALNYADLDRIERNINIIYQLIPISLVSMDRDVIPRIPYFKNLLENVTRIRNSNYRYPTTPPVPTMPLNTYQKINDLETILLHAYSSILRHASDDSLVFCGDDMYADGNVLI